ncbi:arylamine N-acetyltransferase [Streptomyces sp. NBC_00876]|uniref:arylamine N-acetyltransferase family protein n=1 Tax=Streptomyces sp. NBC_00876 TaxID=2975853 RepID=UPI0038654C90|nr:arylamine N-acetyltransferase [Streptomyces sp. NBC_00876]
MDPRSQQTTDSYLERIGAARPARPDAAALRELQLRHLTSVPFENLSIHLGEDIVLEEEALLDKVVADRRGGFCYELNGAFAVLLRALGFRVTLLQARVHGDNGRLGIPYDHMALWVGTDDGTGPWLADVGFGDHAQQPLALDDRTDQEDPRGTFRIGPAPAEVMEGGGETEDGRYTGDRGDAAGYGDLDVLRDGTPQFRLDPRPRALADFTAGAWYHRTSPDSSFTRSPVCSRFTATGRITLKGRKLLTTVGAERHEAPLGSDEEVLAAYREHFGVHLDRLPAGRGADASAPNG